MRADFESPRFFFSRAFFSIYIFFEASTFRRCSLFAGIFAEIPKAILFFFNLFNEFAKGMQHEACPRGATKGRESILHYFAYYYSYDCSNAYRDPVSILLLSRPTVDLC